MYRTVPGGSLYLPLHIHLFLEGGESLAFIKFFPSQQQRHGPYLSPFPAPQCVVLHTRAVQSSVCARGSAATWLSDSVPSTGVLISEGFLHLLVNSAHFSNEPQAAGGSTGVTPGRREYRHHTIIILRLLLKVLTLSVTFYFSR